jgi:hypothetical protein
MNAIFGQYMRQFVLIFMDDILVFSKSLGEHVEHLKKVFQILQDHELFIKFSKCAFAQQKISYLGHIISQDGVSTYPSKIETMLNWPVPQSFTEIMGFKGICGTYWILQKNCGTL